MSTRLIRTRDAHLGRFPWETVDEQWKVLSPDLREDEFEGTLQECQQYLRSQCANGSCEE